MFNAIKVLNDINCKPLEGRLTLTEGKLQDLEANKVLNKQIGLVNGIKIKNSMLNNSILIVHTDDVFDNHSTLLHTNDNIKLTNLNNKIVKFRSNIMKKIKIFCFFTVFIISFLNYHFQNRLLF